MIKSRRTRWTWDVAQKGERRNAYRILVGKPEINITIGNTKAYVGGQY
jgi:hypothetical protein